MHRLITAILVVFAAIGCGRPQVALICDDAGQAEAITELVKGMGYYCKDIEGPEAISSGEGRWAPFRFCSGNMMFCFTVRWG